MFVACVQHTQVRGFSVIFLLPNLAAQKLYLSVGRSFWPLFKNSFIYLFIYLLFLYYYREKQWFWVKPKVFISSQWSTCWLLLLWCCMTWMLAQIFGQVETVPLERVGNFPWAHIYSPWSPGVYAILHFPVNYTGPELGALSNLCLGNSKLM